MEQFIYPQTISELESRFSTDDACREYLMRLRWPNGFVCPRCGRQGGWPATRGRLICRRCRYQASVTAGTVFQDTHKPLRLWFRAIWQITSREHVASARDVQQVLGVKYVTAWSWLNKLRRATVRPEPERLCRHVEVDLTCVDAESTDKNGRRTDKALVVIAVEEDGSSGTGRIRMARIGTPASKSLHRFLRASIAPGSTVHGYGAVGKRDATAADCHYEQVLLEEDQSVTDLLPRLRRVDALLKRWLSGTDRGAVHRDRLDAYLTEFTVRFNRRDALSRGELFTSCSRNPWPPPPWQSVE